MGRPRASILLGWTFLILIAAFSLADLIRVTRGDWLQIASAVGLAGLGAAIVMAVLSCLFIVLLRIDRRIRGDRSAPRPRRLNPPALAASLAWTAFIGAPFVAPAVAAQDWREAAITIAAVAAVVVGFFSVLAVAGLLLSWRSARRRS
jgi:hypothetical protein